MVIPDETKRLLIWRVYVGPRLSKMLWDADTIDIPAAVDDGRVLGDYAWAAVYMMRVGAMKDVADFSGLGF